MGIAKCVGSLSPRIDVSQLPRHGGQPDDMWSLQGLRLQEFCSRSPGAGVNRDDHSPSPWQWTRAVVVPESIPMVSTTVTGLVRSWLHIRYATAQQC